MENQSQNPNPEPSRDELKQRLETLDRMLNVLIHKDWGLIHEYFKESAAGFQNEMNAAGSWEHFIAARACKLFVSTSLMTLPERIKAIKEEIERELAMPEEGPLDPPEYEQE